MSIDTDSALLKRTLEAVMQWRIDGCHAIADLCRDVYIDRIKGGKNG